MDSPSVATVQALVILSALEAAFTRDARGWLYSGMSVIVNVMAEGPDTVAPGMAVRLSADLGLHLNLNDYIHAGTLTQRDIEVRRTTFWGVFIHDK